MNDTDFLGIFSPIRPMVEESPQTDDGNMPDGLLRGEKGRPAYESTDSAALDFFFSVVQGVEDGELLRMLEAAWDEDRVTALRLIFQTGNVRSGGKMDRWNFYKCIVWLWENKPETLLLNIKKIPHHTCLKDLLQLLEFAFDPKRLEQLIAAKKHAKEHKDYIHTKSGKRKRRVSRHERRLATKERFAMEYGKNLADIWKSDAVESMSKPVRMVWIPEFKILWDKFVEAEQTRRVKEFKTAKRVDAAAQTLSTMQIRASSILNKRLFDSIVEIFAAGLQTEKTCLETDPSKLSGLYGKWAPTTGGSCDKYTKISAAIAQKIFPGDPDPAHAYNKLLSTLRAAAMVPEHFVGKGDWKSVDYDRMASRCRLLYGVSVFAKHDKERFKKFLDDAQKDALDKKPGEKVKSVKVGALLPHEVTERAWRALMRIKNIEGGHHEDDGDDEYEPIVDDSKGLENSLERAKMINQVHLHQSRNLI